MMLSVWEKIRNKLRQIIHLTTTLSRIVGKIVSGCRWKNVGLRQWTSESLVLFQ